MKKIILLITTLFIITGCSNQQPVGGVIDETKKIIDEKIIKVQECVEYETATTTLKCKKQELRDKIRKYIVTDEEYPKQKYRDMDEIIDKRKYEDGVGNMQFYKKNEKETILKITFGEKMFHNDEGTWKKVRHEDSEVPLSYKIKSFLLKPVFADTTTVDASPTSGIIQNYPNNNYGASTLDYVQSKATGKNYRAIHRFTMPSSLGTLTDVTLVLTSANSLSSFQFNAHELNRDNWIEAEVTWNKYQSASTWTTGGGDYNATIISSVSDHTGGVGVNYYLMGGSATNPLTIAWDEQVDILIKSNTENFSTTGNTVSYYSDEYTDEPDYKPYILITYTGSSDTCTYGGTGDWNVLESDNCYITANVYVNGSFKLIGSVGNKFGCASGVKVSAENFQFGTGRTTFDMKCFAHH